MEGYGVPGYMGVCQKKCHFGFSKSSKFKRVVLFLVLMTFCIYVQFSNQYCYTKSRLNKEKLTVG